MSAGGGSVGATLAEIAPWTGQALLIGVASARFAFAFLMMPLFSPTIIPATVRNSIIVAFGLIALAMPMTFDPSQLTPSQWLWVYAKEAAAGVTIGFFFGTILWAMAAAGEIIDTKIGATIGQIVDPLSGMSQPLNAVMLSRFAQIIFVSAGGITILVGTIMLSFAVWPLGPGAMRFDVDAAGLFEGEFGRMFAIAFIIAGPALVILYIIDAGMGLLNRFAQQFNVFTLSMPIKSAAATFVLIMILPLLVQAILGDLGTRQDVARGVLQRVGTPAPVAESPTP